VPAASDENPLTDVTVAVAEHPEKFITGFSACLETVTPAVAGEKQRPVETCFTVITWHCFSPETGEVHANGDVAAEVAEAICIPSA
jgi:hypothetical protein